MERVLSSENCRRWHEQVITPVCGDKDSGRAKKVVGTGVGGCLCKVFGSFFEEACEKMCESFAKVHDAEKKKINSEN